MLENYYIKKYNKVMSEILNLKENKLVWEYFYNISQYPRVSEYVKINAYLRSVFEQHKIPFEEDKMGNLYARVPATPGYESKPMLLLQAHSDMVGVKTPESKHDFTKDPLDLYIDGDWIKAKGTTLGADDGIGVAMILAMITDKTVVHGPLEVVFSTYEEDSMMGIAAFDFKKIQSRYAVNIDHGEDHTIIAGCNGMVASDSCFINVHREQATRENSTNYEYHITGGLGGHSGVAIAENRLNCFTHIFAILSTILNECDVRLVEIPTFGRINVIPDTFKCVLNILNSDVAKVKETLEKDFTFLKRQYKSHTELKYFLNQTTSALMPLTSEDNTRIIRSLPLFPNGPLNYNKEFVMADVSCNIGCGFLNKDQFSFGIMGRSLYANKVNYLKQQITDLLNLFGYQHTPFHVLPSWFQTTNKLSQLYVECSKGKLPTLPTSFITGGGLECGFFAQYIPGIECISIGPNSPDIHTFNERLSIKSTNIVTSILKEFLAKIN